MAKAQPSRVVGKRKTKTTPKRKSTPATKVETETTLDFSRITPRQWLRTFHEATTEILKFVRQLKEQCPSDQFSKLTLWHATNHDPNGVRQALANGTIDRLDAPIQRLRVYLESLAKMETVARENGFQIREHAPFSFKPHSIVKVADVTDCTYHRAIPALASSIIQNIHCDATFPLVSRFGERWAEARRVLEIPFEEMALHLKSEYLDAIKELGSTPSDDRPDDVVKNALPVAEVPQNNSTPTGEEWVRAKDDYLNIEYCQARRRLRRDRTEAKIWPSLLPLVIEAVNAQGWFQTDTVKKNRIDLQIDSLNLKVIRDGDLYRMTTS